MEKISYWLVHKKERTNVLIDTASPSKEFGAESGGNGSF